MVRKKNKWLPKLKAWMDENRPGEKMLPYSAQMEQEYFDCPDADAKKAYEEEHKTPSQMGKIITTAYHALQLIHFYTAGRMRSSAGRSARDGRRRRRRARFTRTSSVVSSRRRFTISTTSRSMAARPR